MNNTTTRITTKVTWWISYTGSLFVLQDILQNMHEGSTFDVDDTPIDMDDPSVDDVYANITCESMYAAVKLSSLLEAKEEQTKENFNLRLSVHIESQLCNIDLDIPFKKGSLPGAEIHAKEVGLNVVQQVQKAHDILHKALTKYAMEKL